ncbi:hypothetical protein L9W92_01520 [Pelotomaculum terephthalicicum JT]|uniref:hypothetical protein n=1 Tax=Pelotomaculum TaxID=191373 RepID=UPI0009D1BAF7|nr:MULTISPECIES: hypothetical protein [Pelotomaculum]MCG9966736.1 hypothetical protein [Pelotomaculum terephthalicicum JT]OPX85575.1 MAG: hypothetical protein A4E54_02384 [Pelotomaculum sp. PtaB.Bin117]
MFSLRPGSILDLTVIASDNHVTEVAKSFGIPYSTLTAYISGIRFIRPSAAWDIGTRWGKYINQFLSNILFDKIEKETNTQSIREIPSDWVFEDDPDFEDIRHYAEIFNENFQTEYNLRQIVEPVSWQKSFSCCAAQVLARFEASQSASSKLDVFSKKDAINLLNILIKGPFTEENLPNMLNLALRYVLWRVKTREYYKLEQFYPISRCIEIRDTRPILLLQQEENIYYPPDHKLSRGIQLPDTPRLKKAATLDALMLCRFVEVKADHSKYNYYCSCTSPQNDSIYFTANPIATYESKYYT